MEAASPGGSLVLGSGDVSQIQADRTYRKLLKIHEEQLAKDALSEKRSKQLTMEFLKNAEEFHGRHQKFDAEKSLQVYEKSVRKVKDASDAQGLLQQMVREEKSQIFALMRDKGRSRQEEEASKKEEHQERQKWIHARMAHEKLRAEERQQKLQEQEDEKRREAQERKEHHEAALKAQLTELAEAKHAIKAKHQAEQDRINERRKEAVREAHKVAAEQYRSLHGKAEAAELRKKQELDRVQQAVRDKAESRDKKVTEVKQKREKQTEALLKQISEKADEPRECVKYVNKYAPKRRKATSPLTARRRHAVTDSAVIKLTNAKDDATAAAAGNKAGQEEGLKQESQMAPAKVTSWSREMNEANGNAARDYVLKCQELQDARSEMYRRKQYKALSASARLTERSDDVNTVRLRSLHNMYIAKKPREVKDDKEPRDAESPGSPSRQPRSARGPRGRRLPCGLCCREFPESGLPGTCLKRTLERLRRQFPEAPARPAEAPPSARGDSSDDRHEFELPLCSSCWQFAKIMS